MKHIYITNCLRRIDSSYKLGFECAGMPNYLCFCAGYVGPDHAQVLATKQTAILRIIIFKMSPIQPENVFIRISRCEE